MSDPNGVPGGITTCSSALTETDEIDFAALGETEVVA